MSSWLMHWDCPGCNQSNVVKLSVNVSPRTGRVKYTCGNCQNVYWYGHVKRYAVKNWSKK